MNDYSSTFEEAWQRFQALDSLRLVEDTLESEWRRGRTEYLAFLVPIEDDAARMHIANTIDRLAGIPGVQPYQESYWHITVKGVGFQVIKRTQEDDVLRQHVPRIARRAQELLAGEEAFQARLGLANGFAEVAFVEVLDGGRVRELNARLLEGLPGVPRYPSDGAAFLPHISVARFSSDDGLDDLKAALAALRSEGPGPAFPVRRLEFVKAWLSEEPPEFDVLAAYPLGSPR